MLYHLHNYQEMQHYMHNLVENIKHLPSLCITLTGDLGTGKTACCQEIIQTLLSNRIAVTSPTYNLVNIYQNNNLLIHHYDLYRLNSTEEALNIGIQDSLYNNIITLIEWPNIILDYLPQQYININLKLQTNIRIMQIQTYGNIDIINI